MDDATLTCQRSAESGSKQPSITNQDKNKNFFGQFIYFRVSYAKQRFEGLIPIAVHQESSKMSTLRKKKGLNITFVSKTHISD